MKKRFSSFIPALFGIIFFGGLYGLWTLYASIQVSQYAWTELKPSRINLIAVRPEAGYRILVTNNIAHLAEVQNSTFGNTDNKRDPESEEVSDKRRLPIGDMLKAMQGDQTGLNSLVGILNELNENDLPPNRVIWMAEDIQKAVDGDKALKEKLERNLNVRLDGTPLAMADPNALEDGIVIDYPVPIHVRIEGKPTIMTARIQEAYQSGFALRVVRSYQENANITTDLIRANYVDQAKGLMNGTIQKEDVAHALLARFDQNRQSELAKRPEQVLANTEVVMTEKQLDGASTSSEKSSNDEVRYTINLNLTEDGRMRLWKYSRQNPGFQLLLTVDGIAVAAPRIYGELVTRDVRINQLRDERLAVKAAKVINESRLGESRS